MQRRGTFDGGSRLPARNLHSLSNPNTAEWDQEHRKLGGEKGPDQAAAQNRAKAEPIDTLTVLRHSPE